MDFFFTITLIPGHPMDIKQWFSTSGPNKLLKGLEHHCSVFSVTWSFRNHSKMMIWSSKKQTNKHYYQCWNICVQLFFGTIWWIERLIYLK